MAETSVDVRFPLNSLEGIDNVVSACRRMREYEHEILTIEVVNYDPWDIGIHTGDPVVANLKGAGEPNRTWHGYVHEVREHIDDDKARRVKIICVGPTWVMKDARQRVWRNLTISEIAAKILGEYRLAADIETHSVRIPMLNQQGESDWSFLCRIAKDFGYVVWCDGVTVHFHSRLRDHEARNRSALMLRFRTKHEGERTNVWSFRPVLSDAASTPEGGKAQRIVGGVDPRNPTMWHYGHDGSPAQPTRTRVSTGKFRQYATDVVSSTPAEVKARLAGAHEYAMWNHRAKAELDGYDHIAPTSVVYLDGLSGGYDAYWHVIAVEHVYAYRYAYRMHVEIGTDSLGPPVGSFRPGGLVPIDDGTLTRGGNVRPGAVLVVPGDTDAPNTLRNRAGVPTMRWRSTRASVTLTSPTDATPSFIRRRRVAR